MSVIKAGYRITVTSWENDLDHYQVVSLDGLSRESVAVLVSMCKLFMHCRDVSYDKRVYNLYEPEDEDVARVQTAITDVLRSHGVLGTEGYMDETDAEELLMDLGLMGSEFFTRVCESFVVEHVPSEIILSDVTSEFMDEE